MYLDKIIKNVPSPLSCTLVSVTVPHQSYTPREILRQFVVNDIQVMRTNPSDDISFSSDDAEEVQDHIMQFEDEFQARDYMRNEWKPKYESLSSPDVVKPDVETKDDVSNKENPDVQTPQVDSASTEKRG